MNSEAKGLTIDHQFRAIILTTHFLSLGYFSKSSWHLHGGRVSADVSDYGVVT